MRGWLASTHLLGIASPMLVWALHFVIIYSLQGLACARGWRQVQILGLDGVNVLLILLTAIAIALLAWTGLRAHRRWRQLENDARTAPAARRRRFATAATGLLSLLALVAVLMTALPLFFLPPCA